MVKTYCVVMYRYQTESSIELLVTANSYEQARKKAQEDMFGWGIKKVYVPRCRKTLRDAYRDEDS